LADFTPDYTPEMVRDRLVGKLTRSLPALKKNDDYLEGEQPLRFVAPALREQLGNRIADVVLDIPSYITDVYENRLDIEGFRFAGQDSSDDDLWSIWQHNDGDMLAQQAHRESLGLARAYAIVGQGDDGIPLITAESPFEAIHEDDARTHEVKYGLKRWIDEDKTKWIDLFHPNGRVTWFSNRKSGGWKQDSVENNEFGLCRLVPLINDPRMLGRERFARRGRYDQRLGRSVFHGIIPLADALNKIATDMMVSAEFHAMPRRWATGLNEDDFVDEATGKQLETFELVAGRMWGVSDKDVKFGQFAEADLSNFHNTAKLLMQVAGQLVALPPNYLAFSGDNPASADALKAAETQLVKRAERKQSTLGTRWERVQRLVLLTQGKADSENARQIETLWRDAATPTLAQKADAISKLVTTKDGSGRSIIGVEQAREDLGYTSEQRRRMAAADQADSNSALLAAVQAASESERAAGAGNGNVPADGTGAGPST
jgi:hypothetical protein